MCFPVPQAGANRCASRWRKAEPMTAVRHSADLSSEKPVVSGMEFMRMSADQHRTVADAYRKRAVTEPRQAMHFLRCAREQDELEREAASGESRGEMPTLPQPPGWVPRRAPMPCSSSPRQPASEGTNSRSRT